MTACDNEQARISGKKVVSATLVGALAAGMVPAMALAAEGVDEVSVDEGIELLSASAVDAFETAELRAVEKGGKVIEVAEGETFSVVQTDTNKEFKPTKMQIPNTGDIFGKDGIIDVKGVAYEISYQKIEWDSSNSVWKDAAPLSVSDLNSATLPLTKISSPGAANDVKYQATLTAVDGEFDTGEVVIPFEVVTGTAKDVTVFDSSESDTTFTYNGKDQAINVAYKGKEVNASNYDIEYGVVGGAASATAPKAAGNYYAVITGKANSGFLGLTATVNFTVDALDLSKADLTIANQAVGQTGIAAPTNAKVLLNGATMSSDLQNKLDPLTWMSGKDAKGGTINEFSTTKAGTYVYKATVASPTDKDVIGSKEITTNVGEVLLTATDDKINYGSEGIADANIDLREESYDLSKIKVLGSDDKALDKTKYEVIVKDSKGEKVDPSKLKEVGVWFVTVNVKDTSLKYVGSETVTITCNKGTLTTGNVYVKQNGKVVTTVNADYTGEDIMSGIEVIVLDDNGKALVAGEDYKVAYTNEAGDDVKEIINAGDYKISVTSDVYSTIKDEITVSVNQVNLKNEGVSATDTLRQAGFVKFGADDPFIPYTGQEIVPVFEYTTDGKTWKTLPADAYTSTIKLDSKAVDMVKEEGEYTIDLEAIVDGNFTIAITNPLAFTVSNDKYFLDVPSNEWFFDSVVKANQLGYMNGIGGTKVFGSYQSITRADVACVLYNMAGAENKIGADDVENPDNLYRTPFSDVDPQAYYARALAWAAKSGVVNGISGTTTYEPERSVSREEFGAMLANYAKVSGAYEAVETDKVLADFPDGAAVSAWAKDSVAWAAANKYMGNGGVLDPIKQIIRAEVAAVAVNYQPKAL